MPHSRGAIPEGTASPPPAGNNAEGKAGAASGAGWSTHGLGYLRAGQQKQRLYLIHPFIPSAVKPADRSPQAALEEAANLARAIDIELVGERLVPLRVIRSSTFLGRGKIAELAEDLERLAVEIVVVDTALSPIQQRNLEKALSCKVIDRTALILEIFGARAQTREGELQVELAHLTYQRSRLVRSWTHLERQRGGMGFLGGPGETQIEADRRIINDRIALLKRQLDEVVRTRRLHRARRQKAPYPVIALVGYTNAGKSTLFNRLTNAAVLAEDMLFATLDPTLRKVVLPSGRRVMMSDTVGFISDLPTALVAAFRATLEEVLEADIILHIRDASHPDADIQKRDVEMVLKELMANDKPLQHRAADRPSADDAGGVPIIEVLNKSDALAESGRTFWSNRAARDPQAVLVSGLSGEGSADLLECVDRVLSAADIDIDIVIPFSNGRAQAWLRANSQVHAATASADGMHFTVRIEASRFEQFRQHHSDAQWRKSRR